MWIERKYGEEALRGKREKERKIWRAGKSSYVTALPPKWAKMVQEMYGGRISLLRLKDALVLSPLKVLEKRYTKVIVKDDDEKKLQYDIIGAYLQDYDEVLVEFKQEVLDYISVLKNQQQRLPGTSYKPVSRYAALIKMMTELRRPEELMENMYQLYHDMYRANFEAMKKLPLDTEEASQMKKQITEMETGIDMNSFEIQRLFYRILSEVGVPQESGVANRGDIISMARVAQSIERLGDLQEEIFDQLCLLNHNNFSQPVGKLKSVDLLSQIRHDLPEQLNKAHETVQKAYKCRDNEKELLEVIKSKGEKGNEQYLWKQMIGYNTLADATRIIGLIEYKIEGMIGNASNIAQAWLNMQKIGKDVS